MVEPKRQQEKAEKEEDERMILGGRQRIFGSCSLVDLYESISYDHQSCKLTKPIFDLLASDILDAYTKEGAPTMFTDLQPYLPCEKHKHNQRPNTEEKVVCG